MTVLIADDHFAVREGLKSILASDPALGGTRLLEAGSLAEARSILAGGPVDLVLLDLNFPDGNGLELIQEARGSGALPRWLVLSMHQEGSFVVRALQAGAQGFLSKDSAGGVLVEAFRALIRGEVFLDQASLQRLAAHLRTLPQEALKADQGISGLSDREREVLFPLLHGKSVKEIAFELGISAKTVENHRSALFRKLGLESLSDLFQFARDHYLF